jgi:hypothetical protein
MSLLATDAGIGLEPLAKMDMAQCVLAIAEIALRIVLSMSCSKDQFQMECNWIICAGIALALILNIWSQ